mgnify:CR=1 FL=1
MALISRITSVNPATGVVSKVAKGTRGLQTWQLGQYTEGNRKYQEIYVQGHNYFKHIKAMFKDGKMIKGSKFSEEIVGPEANSRVIHKFGVEA